MHRTREWGVGETWGGLTPRCGQEDKNMAGGALWLQNVSSSSPASCQWAQKPNQRAKKSKAEAGWEMDRAGSETVMAEGTDEGLGGVLLVGEAKRREPDQSRGAVRHTDKDREGDSVRLLTKLIKSKSLFWKMYFSCLIYLFYCLIFLNF